MMLFSRLTSKQVLEKLGQLAQDSLPDGAEGKLHLQYDDDDGVEIYFIPDNEVTQA